MPLSPNLIPIRDMELSRGNSVDNWSSGEACQLYVVMTLPLNRAEIESKLKLSAQVAWIETGDLHHPAHWGYQCQETGHCLVGPPADGRTYHRNS